MHRRNFLGMTGAAGSALLLPGLPEFKLEKDIPETNPASDLQILATNWGFVGTVDQFCAAAKKEGYNGIELWWPVDKKGQDDLFSALKKHSLSVGFLCGGYQTDWKEHLETFRANTTAAATNTIQKPLYVNCHSGRDHFSMTQNAPFIEHTDKLAKETGVIICHETHRSRIMFAAHVTRQYLEKYPSLKLTFDVSHWCNVHETLLADQAETVAMALERVEHIHARIGHQEGPQVNDPRAPEWDAAVKQHFAWWDTVVARKKSKGERVTILTEFGPPDYMPTVPYTRQPVADQWGINVYMMQQLRKRYGG